MKRVFLAAFFSAAIAHADTRMMTGSGFYVADGTVVTCAHVVEGASKIEIIGSNGIRESAIVKYQDRIADIAILHIGGTAPGTLKLADVASIAIMDPIVVVGFPLASAIGSEISASAGHINAIRKTPTGALLQIDAVMNPGNSGGPVLGATGEVVGVCVSKMGGANTESLNSEVAPEMVNFAVPSPIVKEICQSAGVFIRGGRSDRELTAKDIFDKATAATVLIYAQQDSAIQAEKVLPRTKDDRRVGIWAQAFLESLASSNTSREAGFYGETVDYKSVGSVDRRALAQIIAAEHAKWPHRSIKLERYGVIQKNAQDDAIGVAIVYSFSMSGPGDARKSGKMQAEVLLSNFSRRPEITYYREGVQE